MGARDFEADFPLTDVEVLNDETLSAITKAMRKGFSILKVETPVSLSRWAEEHFYLSAESSQKQQRWIPYPFQPGIMDAMGDDRIFEVDVQKSARVGYTKMLLASIAYDAHHKKRNQALWQPTDSDSDSFTKTELEPMLRDVKVMRKIFPAFKKKSKENTLKLKAFLGSLLHLLGATASKNFRRITVASAKLDEVDGMDQIIEKAADPVTLSRKRLEGATFPKHILGSTPRIKGLSHVEGRVLVAQARMNYQVTCPHCGLEHPLAWGGEDKAYGFKWDKENPGEVWHQCHHCHGKISQADYLRIAPMGAWVSECGAWRFGADRTWRDAAGMPTRPPRHVAFKVWTAYSPQATWAEIVSEFLNAMAKRRTGDKGPLMGWINETLGETWEDDESEKLEADALQERAEAFALRAVPMGGLVLVAGVDVQDDRFEVVVWAIGRGEEMWCVDYAVIPADPAVDEEWTSKLAPYLQTVYTHESGAPMAIQGVGIDMMGHFTHQGYNFVRFREKVRVFGVRGDPTPGQPISAGHKAQDVNYKGSVIKKGVKLWYVGADTAKDLLFARLKVRNPGPGYVHFSNQLPAAFYSQLTAESRVPTATARGMVTRWVNVNRLRNEALDCTVYALFVAHRMALHTKSEAAWRAIERKLGLEPRAPRPLPVSEQAESDPPAPPPPPAAPRPKPRRPAPAPASKLARLG
jgi:phage terminase large subunit GpA-like protein